MERLRALSLGLGLAALGCGGDSVVRTAGSAVPLRGRYEVVERFLDGRDALTVVGDCNGDGRVDFVNMATLFVQRADGSFAPTMLEGMSGRKAGTMVDLDGDGAMDLVLAGTDVVWRRGDGACGFGAPMRIAPDVEGEPAQILVRDVDQDGLADLTVARQERRERAFQLLVARGDGRFDDRTPPPTPMARHQDVPYRTFATFYDDVDGDGTLDLFALTDHDLGWFSWGVAGEAMTFAQDPAVTANITPISPMALSPLDVDRDGVFEYFVSGTFGNHRLYRYEGDRRLVDAAARAGLREPGSRDDGWGTLAFDANLDGYPDLLVREEPDDHRGDGPVRLFVNRGDGTFALAPVIDAQLSGTSLACADFEADARVSCLARDRGMRGLVLLRNRIEHRGAWVGVRLRGTVSSPDASGAHVALDGARPPLVVMAGGQSPTLGEHDRGVILALGAATTASVTVTWPSGIVQHVTGLAAGRYATIVEPAALTLSTRVAAADGSSQVEVIADPRAVGASAVNLLCEGVCAWIGPATVDAQGRHHRALVAPASAGFSRVGLALDGVPLRVRPRVRWE